MGSLIGAVGGLAFVLINAGSLPAGAAWGVRILGVLGFLAVIYLVVRPRSDDRTEAPPSRSQIRVYGISVTAMALAIVLGARLLTALDHSELIVLWVVIAVGAHFVPFASAFHLPFFARLGWLLVGLSVAGAIVTLLTDAATVPAWVAVIAGLVLLAVSLRPALAGRHLSADRQTT